MFLVDVKISQVCSALDGVRGLQEGLRGRLVLLVCGGGGPGLGLLDPLPAVYLEEHGAEDADDAQLAQEVDRVRVVEAGDDDGHSLSDGHNDDEGDGAELGDGVVDEQLAHGGAHRQDHAVKAERRKL